MNKQNLNKSLKRFPEIENIISKLSALREDMLKMAAESENLLQNFCQSFMLLIKSNLDVAFIYFLVYCQGSCYKIKTPLFLAKQQSNSLKFTLMNCLYLENLQFW